MQALNQALALTLGDIPGDDGRLDAAASMASISAELFCDLAVVGGGRLALDNRRIAPERQLTHVATAADCRGRRSKTYKIRCIVPRFVTCSDAVHNIAVIINPNNSVVYVIDSNKPDEEFFNVLFEQLKPSATLTY